MKNLLHYSIGNEVVHFFSCCWPHVSWYGVCYCDICWLVVIPLHDLQLCRRTCYSIFRSELFTKHCTELIDQWLLHLSILLFIIIFLLFCCLKLLTRYFIHVSDLWEVNRKQSPDWHFHVPPTQEQVRITEVWRH